MSAWLTSGLLLCGPQPGSRDLMKQKRVSRRKGVRHCLKKIAADLLGRRRLARELPSGLLCRDGRGLRLAPGKWPERQNDEEGAEADGPGADIKPRVTPKRIVDQAARDGPRRHAEASGHRQAADHRTEHPYWKVLAHQHRIKRHGAGIDEAEQCTGGVEFGQMLREDVAERAECLQ